MNFRRLGRTRLVVSEIGFSVPGLAPPHRAFQEAVDALKRAHRNHASLFWLESIESTPLFKAAFEGAREEAVIGLTVPAGPLAAVDAARRWMEALETDWLDLIFVETDEAEPAMIAETLNALEADGTVRAAGVACAEPGPAAGWKDLPIALPWRACEKGLPEGAGVIVLGVHDVGAPVDIGGNPSLAAAVLATPLSTPGIACAVVATTTVEEAEALTSLEALDLMPWPSVTGPAKGQAIT